MRICAQCYSACHGGMLGAHYNQTLSTKDAVALILSADKRNILTAQPNKVACNIILLFKFTTEEERRDLRRDGKIVYYHTRIIETCFIPYI